MRLVPRRWYSSVLVLACCGRVGFDPAAQGDAGSNAATDGGRLPAALVQTTTGMTVGTSLSISLPTPTRGGDLLVVLSGSFNVAEALSAVTDDANNAYRSANALAVWTAASDLVEIWYAPDSKPGATSVTLVGVGTASREGWFLELSGLDPVAPLESVATTDNGPSTSTPATPPVLVTTGGSVVVGLADVTNGVSQLQASSGFVPLPVQFGNGAAYTIAQAPGTYSAVWDDPTPGMYCAAAAVFRP